MGNRLKLKPKKMRFLEEYAKCGNHADAYLAAGYKAKTRESARVSGYRLLRKLDENMDYREILEAVGLTDRRIAEALNLLVEHKDARVRVQAIGIAARVKGWQRDEASYGPSFTLVINQTVSQEEIDKDNAIDMTPKPVKPRAITD